MSPDRVRGPDRGDGTGPRGDRAQQGTVVVTIVVIVLVALVILALMSYSQVPAGHVGVERQFGAVTGTTYQPGAHLIAPWVGIQHVEIRERTYTMTDSQGEGQKAAAADAVEVKTVNGTRHRVDVTIRYRVKETEAVSFVRQWQNIPTAERRIIRPTVRSTLRDEGSALTSTNIFTQKGRQRLEAATAEALRTEFKDKALVLEAVQIRQVTIESKQLQQELNARAQAKVAREKQENLVEVERQKAKRKKIRAEADAEVIRIKGEALRKNPQVLVQRYIDALRNGSNNVIYVPLGSGGIPTFIDVGQGTNGTSFGGQAVEVDRPTATPSATAPDAAGTGGTPGARVEPRTRAGVGV